MLLVGSLVVLCGLLAQSSAQLAGLPLPLGQGLPLPQDQGLPSDPTGHLAGSFTDGESMTVSFRVCVDACLCLYMCALVYSTSQYQEGKHE